MLFHPLSLVLPVVLAIANPLVGRSEVTALQKAFIGINNTMYAIHEACNAFAINVDRTHAEAVLKDSRTIQSQVVGASKVVPVAYFSLVISASSEAVQIQDVLDGEWICDSYTSASSPGLQLFEEFIALKKDFQSVGLLNDTCLLLQKSSTDNDLLDSKLLDVTPDSWKACVQRYQEISENMTVKVLEAYCGHS